MLTLIERAFSLAIELHGRQYRKASIVPKAAYMSHLTEVAGMVWGCFSVDDSDAETVVASALLRGAIEDQPLCSPRALIGRHCDSAVLDLVEDLTEKGSDRAEKAPWQERKLAYLGHISEMSVYALLISVCDKLQSARELKRQVRRQGDAAYHGFVKEVAESERKGLVLWFHNNLVLSYLARLSVIGRESAGPLIAAIQVLLDELAEVVLWLEEH